MCRYGLKYFEILVLNVIVLLEIYWFFNEFGGNNLVCVWSVLLYKFLGVMIGFYKV